MDDKKLFFEIGLFDTFEENNLTSIVYKNEIFDSFDTNKFNRLKYVNLKPQRTHASAVIYPYCIQQYVDWKLFDGTFCFIIPQDENNLANCLNKIYYQPWLHNISEFEISDYCWNLHEDQSFIPQYMDDYIDEEHILESDCDAVLNITLLVDMACIDKQYFPMNVYYPHYLLKRNTLYKPYVEQINNKVI